MRSFLSILFGFILALIISVGAFILMIPSIISTDWGKKQTISWISSSIPGSIEIENLELRWGHGQLIQGFSLKDTEGKAVLGFDTFSTEAPLWQLIQQNPCWGLTRLANFNAAIITDDHGETNLQKALGIDSAQSPSPLTSSTIVLSDVNIESDLFTPHHPFLMKIKGKTKQRELDGSFNISIFLPGLTASNWGALKEIAENYLSIEESKKATLQVDVDRFPVDLLDRLIALHAPRLNGLFYSLLGNRLDLSIEKEASEKGLLFYLDVISPLMKGGLKGIVNGKTLSLREQASFHFKLSPDSVNPFVESRFNLLTPSDVWLTFSDLTIPLSFPPPNEKGDPSLFSFVADLQIPKTEIDVDSSETITISNLKATISSPPYDKQVHILVTGKAQQAKQPFDFDLSAAFAQPDHLLDLSDKISQTLNFDFNLSNFPLETIPLFRKHPKLSDKIGSTATAQLKITPSTQSGWAATLSLTTPNTLLKEVQFIIGNEITLVKPLSLQLTAPSDYLAELFRDEKLKLATPCALNFSFKRFQAPLDNLHLAAFEFEITASPLRFNKLSHLETLQVNNLKLKVEAKNLGALESEVHGDLSLINNKESPSPLIPDSLRFKQTSVWGLGKTGKLELTESKLQAQNSITTIAIEGVMNSEKIFSLSQPAQILYTLSPQAFEFIAQQLGKNWPELKEPVPLDLVITPSSIDLGQFSLSNIHLEGVLKIKKMIFQENSKNYPILEGMVVPWMIDTSRNNIYANIKGTAYSEKDRKPSPISSNIQLWLTPGHYDFAHTRSEIRMNFTGMPTAIFNIFFAAPNLIPIIGPILDVNLKAFYDPTQKNPGYLDMAVDSTNFHSDIRFKSTNRLANADDVKKPIIRLTITPEGYPHIQKFFSFPDDRRLSAPFTVTAKLADFDIPLEGNWLKGGFFNLELSTTEIVWDELPSSPWKLKGDLKADGLNDRLNFSFIAEAETPVTVEGSFSNLVTQSGDFQDWSKIGLKFKAKGINLTPPLLQRIFPLSKGQQKQIQALVGDQFNLDLQGESLNFTGPLACSIEGSEGNFYLDGALKNGILSLNRPLEASVKLTPLFTQTFLAKNLPLLRTAIGTETPITLLIDPFQFSCPLIPFQFEKIAIGKGVLDLAKIKLRNEGDLKSVLNIIKPLPDPYVTVWFTPIHFKLNQGLLTLSRFDMLIANSYTLANRGVLNFLNHQSDFILGLTASTLRDAFGLQGINDNYILQVPLSIKKGKVEVDKKKVTARIASLLTQSHGGDKGKLLGTIFDTVLSEKGEAYPAPTTQPFPWESELKSPPQDSSEAKESKDMQSEKQKTHPDEKKEKKKKKEKFSKDPSLNELKENAVRLLDRWIK